MLLHKYIQRSAFFIISLIFLSTTALSSQEMKILPGDQLQIFHLFGLTMGSESRILTEEYQLDTARDYKAYIPLTGINYASLIGSRLGFYSDLYVQIPLEISEQRGIHLDYTGGVGWNLWYGNWGFLPGLGFHMGYTYLKDDGFSEGEDMFYLSIGLGGGMRILYRLSNSLLIYTGISGNYDTQEFSTNPRYRERGNSFKRAFDYKGSAGIGFEL